jgi:hypothetical protein
MTEQKNNEQRALEHTSPAVDTGGKYSHCFMKEPTHKVGGGVGERKALEHFSRLTRFLDNKSGSNTDKRRKCVPGLTEEELRRGIVS